MDRRGSTTTVEIWMTPPEMSRDVGCYREAVSGTDLYTFWFVSERRFFAADFLESHLAAGGMCGAGYGGCRKPPFALTCEMWYIGHTGPTRNTVGHTMRGAWGAYGRLRVPCGYVDMDVHTTDADNGGTATCGANGCTRNVRGVTLARVNVCGDPGTHGQRRASATQTPDTHVHTLGVACHRCNGNSPHVNANNNGTSHQCADRI